MSGQTQLKGKEKIKQWLEERNKVADERGLVRDKFNPDMVYVMMHKPQFDQLTGKAVDAPQIRAFNKNKWANEQWSLHRLTWVITEVLWTPEKMPGNAKVYTTEDYKLKLRKEAKDAKLRAKKKQEQLENQI